MSFRKNGSICIFLVGLSFFNTGCSTKGGGAPIIDRNSTNSNNVNESVTKTVINRTGKETASQNRDWRPKQYLVKRGDTLTEIALNHGLSYRELARWNNISNPDLITIGAILRLTPNLPSQKEISRKATLQNKTKIADKEDEKSGRSKYIAWIWPVNGKIVYEFGNGENTKGIGILSTSSEAVVASAPGVVVYSGNGIRAYGNMIIIKHNATYLSVYAHNRLIMVKEGQAVAQGQKISEVNISVEGENRLHFEIRRLGRPVDPKSMLPSMS